MKKLILILLVLLNGCASSQKTLIYYDEEKDEYVINDKYLRKSKSRQFHFKKALEASYCTKLPNDDSALQVFEEMKQEGLHIKTNLSREEILEEVEKLPEYKP